MIRNEQNMTEKRVSFDIPNDFSEVELNTTRTYQGSVNMNDDIIVNTLIYPKEENEAYVNGQTCKICCLHTKKAIDNDGCICFAGVSVGSFTVGSAELLCPACVPQCMCGSIPFWLGAWIIALGFFLIMIISGIIVCCTTRFGKVMKCFRCYNFGNGYDEVEKLPGTV